MRTACPTRSRPDVIRTGFYGEFAISIHNCALLRPWNCFNFFLTLVDTKCVTIGSPVPAPLTNEPMRCAPTGPVVEVEVMFRRTTNL